MLGMGPETPQATYRGYRLQALYALHRALIDPDAERKLYRPEGAEDLEIQDLDGRPIEHVQVKAHSEDLTLSSFKLQKPNSYFWRVYRRMKAKVPGLNILGSYGSLGPELEGAFRGDPKFRDDVAKKLSQQSMTLSDRSLRMTCAEATKVISSISPVRLNEPVLVDAILSKLALTIMGFEPKVALELLLWSIFRASETGDFFTRAKFQARAVEIANALSNFKSFHQEWGTSVVPLLAECLSEEKRKQLERSEERRVGKECRSRWS